MVRLLAFTTIQEKVRNMMIHPIVRQIVGRLHVGESNMTVIREVLAAIRPGQYRAMARHDRHDLLRQIIRCHQENRQLYHDVAFGRF